MCQVDWSSHEKVTFAKIKLKVSFVMTVSRVPPSRLKDQRPSSRCDSCGPPSKELKG